MVMIAVLHEHIDTGIREPSHERAELPRYVLREARRHDVVNRHGADSVRIQRGPARIRVIHEKVRDRRSVQCEQAASLQTDSGAAQDLTELGERSGTRPQDDFDVFVRLLHAHTETTVGATSTAPRSEFAI